MDKHLNSNLERNYTGFAHFLTSSRVCYTTLNKTQKIGEAVRTLIYINVQRNKIVLSDQQQGT